MPLPFRMSHITSSSNPSVRFGMFALVRPAIVNCVLQKILFWIIDTFFLDTLEFDWVLIPHTKLISFLRRYSWLEENSGQSIGHVYLDARLVDYFSAKAETHKEHALKSCGSFTNMLKREWSVLTTVYRPIMQYLNFYRPPHWTPTHLCSIWESRDSVSVKDREPIISTMCCFPSSPICRIQAPTPIMLASHWRIVFVVDRMS